GKKTYIAGHEGLEIGLLAMYRETGEPRYWKLAGFFLDERGKDDYPRQASTPSTAPARRITCRWCGRQRPSATQFAPRIYTSLWRKSRRCPASLRTCTRPS
ncbi:MAG TPA: beta-L-arabinofuranosidase domain-containing protein, partial [Bryobacteraceae bacterium]|nr:beta-L-arabinofuranosidase domain-containing protein [Bryobacteraceae bacterium]